MHNDRELVEELRRSLEQEPPTLPQNVLDLQEADIADVLNELSLFEAAHTLRHLPLETAIRILTSEPATLFGMEDRGVVAPGMKADLNVLDVDALQPHPLEIVYDLPAGAKRIVQHADGFVSTIVAGEVVAELGADTGARPGRVVRSAP